MNKAQELMQKMNEAREALYESEYEFAEFIFPIIKEAGLGNPHNEHISDVYEGSDKLYIETTWSARNCSNNSSYQIPLSILNAENPLEAAKAYKKAEEKRKAEETRQRTIAQIERLQNSLKEQK